MFTESVPQFIPSPAGNNSPNSFPELDNNNNMPNDFQFLADTELNFDPRYDLPRSNLFVVFGSLQAEYIHLSSNSGYMEYLLTRVL